MSTQALRPDFLIKNMPSMQPAPTGEGPTNEERALHYMSQTDGWVKFTAFKEELLADMRKVEKEAIAKGLTFEQIGQNTVISNMALEVIERLFNKVSDAAEVVEQNGTK